MKTYHIHISGLVQGVGFRPHVFKIAEQAGLNGWVSNTKDGVHIEINAEKKTAENFYRSVIEQSPLNAVITGHKMNEVAGRDFSSFSIIPDETDNKPDLLLTPDFAMCDDCRKEIFSPLNRRYRYPFTTCLHCGPRFSITRALPYERYHTTMSQLDMCETCTNEYNNVHDRRHYSQTNSCHECGIPMHLYSAKGEEVSCSEQDILSGCTDYLEKGLIIAVKGIGGYLLICDATNELAIQQLRKRKHRPAKPFALLYAGIDHALKDVYITEAEQTALQSKAAPIVLCRLKQSPENNICPSVIAPGLDKIGLMLPYAPLLQLLASDFGKPLIATSANISGSPIIINDEEALEKLSGIADYIITHEREIVVPQDDSVVQLTDKAESIIIRRSRGLAPNYFPNPFEAIDECVLATGGELKSAFALQDRHLLYVSQFLGNQESIASQEAFTKTSNHFFDLLQVKPSILLADKHPGYFVTQRANELSLEQNIPLFSIQHHEAHFGAVLAENELMYTKEPVLGVIWDGAGYGDDRQVWGGEFFVFEDGEMNRVVQFDYFPQLLGDKMSREPRLSALSLLKQLPAKQSLLKPQFSSTEWQYYQQLINQPTGLLTSSAGRLLDAVASMLGVCYINTYEGEAAMKLEALARTYDGVLSDYYPLPVRNNRVDLLLFLQDMLNDLEKGMAVNHIAAKVFYSLALTVGRVSDYLGIERIAFSGGVFQNALLTNMIDDLYGEKKMIFRHRRLSPNDECIGFGQIACYHIMRQRKTAGNLLMAEAESEINQN
ncbi:MAG TPA: carbamoyltransferase HypF [Chitinophagaceae bacterium]|nr:carbamoyltransferase HypF [Chitinophagaceae bacterium]